MFEFNYFSIRLKLTVLGMFTYIKVNISSTQLLNYVSPLTYLTS